MGIISRVFWGFVAWVRDHPRATLEILIVIVLVAVLTHYRHRLLTLEGSGASTAIQRLEGLRSADEKAQKADRAKQVEMEAKLRLMEADVARSTAKLVLIEKDRAVKRAAAEELSAHGTSADIVKKARELGFDLVPLRRPR